MKDNKLSNQEIVTIALYNLGGGIGSFSIELIATEADKLAPGRFRWKTNPEMISDSNTWDALSNARKKKYILQQSQEKNTDSYMLTEEGIKFAKQNLNKVKNFDQSKVRIPVSRELYDNTKSRLQATEAYKKMTSNRANEISSREYNDFFRLNNYMKNTQKNEKIQKIKNLFLADKELKKVIDELSKMNLTGEKNDQST